MNILEFISRLSKFTKVILFLIVIFIALAATRRFDVYIIDADIGDMFVRENYERRFAQYELYTNLRDFYLDGNVITSTSNDPWIFLDITGVSVFKYIRFDINLLGRETVEAQFFYLPAVREGYFSEAESIRQIIRSGINYIRVPQIEHRALRLDLVEEEGVSLVVNWVELTNRRIPSLPSLLLLIFLNVLWCGIWFVLLFRTPDVIKKYKFSLFSKFNFVIKILLFIVVIFIALAATRRFDVYIIDADIGDMFVRENYERRFAQYELYANLRDFYLAGNVITSTSNDPWIFLYIDGINVKYIRMDIDLLDREKIEAQFFYLPVGWDHFSGDKSVRQTIRSGINYIRVPQIEHRALRLDLTEEEGVSLIVNWVELTNRRIPALLNLLLLILLNILWCGIWLIVLFKLKQFIALFMLKHKKLLKIIQIAGCHLHPVLINKNVIIIAKCICAFFISWFLLLFFSRFIIGIGFRVIPIGLDPSWQLALSRISTSCSLLWGKDITFTYGPFGFLLHGQRYILSILFGIVLLIMNAFLFLFNFIKRIFSLRTLLVFSVVLFFFVRITNFEWMYNLTLFFFFSTFWNIKDNKYLFSIFSFISGLACSFSLLLKFSAGVLSLGLAIVFGLFIFVFHRKYYLKYFIIFSSAYMLLLFCNILFHFGSINNFILWLVMSIEISRGYSSSMVLIGESIYLIFAAFIILLCLLCFINTIIKKQYNGVYYYMLGLVILFFSFKHGFVRQDGHILSFFFALPFLLGFIYLFTKINFTAIIFAATMLISLNAIILYFGVGIISNNPIQRVHHHLVNFNENRLLWGERKENALAPNVLSTEWNDIIGDDTIQILPWELSYAIANNWKGWIPNPVLQLYSVYTHKLDIYSSLSFSEKRAPRFILLEYNTIDIRNMFLDTPTTWNKIIGNYHIIKSDDSRLLLERNNIHSQPNFTQFGASVYRFNDRIVIPELNNNVYARVTIRKTILGRLITTLFRGSPLDIRITYLDGREVTRRLISDTLRGYVLVDVIPDNFLQMKYFFKGRINDDFTVREIVFLTNHPFMYRNEIKIDWFYNSDVNRIQFLRQNDVNNDVNIDYSKISSIIISDPLAFLILLRLNAHDIYLVDIIDDNIVLKCGTFDPFVVLPLYDAPIEKPDGNPFVEITFTNTRAGRLQVFYNYGDGFSERNSSLRHIMISNDEKIIRLPIVGWYDDKRLEEIRIDPPDGTTFTIKGIRILSMN